MPDRIVIIGAGQSAAQAVETLRRCDFKGSIVVVGDESHLPYHRPPLSKKYLAGQLDTDRLLIRSSRYYAEHEVELRLGARAVSIERRDQRVRLEDGSDLAYDALLIATGSRPRRLSIHGADLDGVFYVRTIGDIDAVRAACAPGRRLVAVGGGYIGLEVAATARQLGLETTVLETAERVMQRVVCPEISRFYQVEHERRGVDIICGTKVAAIVARGASGAVHAVQCEEGREHRAELVVVGVGVAPVQDLAEAAELACDDGILIDERCRTSDAAIYAAGDCANQLNARFGRRLRLGSVDNAVTQATTAALSMLGEDLTVEKVPWFWSEQFDLKLVIVGVSAECDTTVIRGSVHSRSFSACHLREGELIAVETVNRPADQMAARHLIAARVCPDLGKLLDSSRALKDCI